jgi:ankyrin repeat protein
LYASTHEQLYCKLNHYAHAIRYERQIIVLSDGELQDGRDVLRMLRQYRYERRLWVLSFGDRANRVLLAKIAAEGDGESEYVTSSCHSVQPATLRVLERCQMRPKVAVSAAMTSLSKSLKAMGLKSTGPTASAHHTATPTSSDAELATALWETAVVTADASALAALLDECGGGDDSVNRSGGRRQAHAVALASEKKPATMCVASKGRQSSIDIGSALESNGRTALHHAASRGDVDVAATLLKRAAVRERVDAPDPAGRTALHWAAWRGDIVMVRLLVEKGGAVPDKTDSDGITPAFLARQERHDGLAKYLHAAVGRTPLHWAAFNNDLVRADEIISSTEANTRADGRAESFRSEREQKENDEAVARKALVVDALDAHGLSPLFIAEAQGHHGVATLLKKHGARDAADARRFHADTSESRWTPLAWATFRGDVVRCAHLVEELRADATDRTYRGLTPLELADSRGACAAAAAQYLRNVAVGSPTGGSPPRLR